MEAFYVFKVHSGKTCETLIGYQALLRCTGHKFGELCGVHRHSGGLVSRVCPHKSFPVYLARYKAQHPKRRSRSWQRSQSSLSDEEMKQLEALGKREGLTVEQMMRLGINDFMSQPDDAFRASAKRALEKNAELYRRLS